MTNTETTDAILDSPWEHPLRVWWIPQIPMKPFHVDVRTPREAILISETLAAYDAFQYENNVKPDYSNAGGVEEFLGPINSGDDGWYSVDDEVFGEWA